MPLANLWTKLESLPDSGITPMLLGVTYGNNIVVVGLDGKILTSYDGITWTTRTSGISNPLYESPTDETHSSCLLGKALLLLLCKPEKVFRSVKKTRVKL